MKSELAGAPGGIRERIPGHGAAYARLPLFAIAITAVAIATMALWIYLQRLYLLSHTGRALRSAAADIAHEIDRNVLERRGDMLVASRMLAVIGSDPATSTRYLHTLREAYPIYAWLCVTDSRGRIVAATDSTSRGQDRSREPWFAAALEEQENRVWIGDARLSADAGGVMSVLFSSPFWSERREFLGAIAAEVPLPAWEAQIIEATLGGGVILENGRGMFEWVVISRQGDVLIDSVLREEGKGNLRRLGVPSAQLCFSSPPGYIEEMHARRKVPVVTGYAQTAFHPESPRARWGVLLRKDRSAVLAPATELLWRVGLPGGLLFFPLVVLLFWASRHLMSEWSDVEHRNRALSALLEAAREITAESDLQSLLAKILDRARLLTGATYGAVGVLDHERHCIAQFITSGIDEATGVAIGSPPTGRGILGLLCWDNGVLRLSDLTQHPSFSGFPPHHPPMRSFLGVPIQAHGRRFASLFLTEKRGRAGEATQFTDLDEQIVSTFALQSAVAIENSSLIADLKASEANYRLLTESVEEGILGLDTDGRCVFMNEAASRMLGYRLQELVGREVHPIVHCSREDCPIFLAQREGRAVRLDNMVLCRADGTSFHAEWACARIHTANGAARGIVVTFWDITEKQQVRERLAHAQKMEALGRLAGGVAHDFNNVLTAVMSCSELLRLRPLDRETVDRYCDTIETSAQRGATLVHRLLAFGRREVLQPGVLNLNAVIGEQELVLRSILGESIELRTLLDPSIAPIRADLAQLEQIILNLALNAGHAMPTSGSLTIETGNLVLDRTGTGEHADVPPGAYVVLSFSDTGCGMDAAVQSHLFEPFFTTKERGKGTGLGLFTVFGIVKQTSGHVRVRSAPGQGTTFRIYIPACGGEP